MENSQPPASESFSVNWSINPNHKSSFFDTIIKEAMNTFHHQDNLDFNFHLDFSTSCNNNNNSLVHADEIFSNGYIKPVFEFESRKQQKPSLDHEISPHYVSRRLRLKGFLRKLVKYSSNNVLIGFGGCLRNGCRVEDFHDHHQHRDDDDYGRLRNMGILPIRAINSCEIESPIDEAILHCKRSFASR